MLAQFVRLEDAAETVSAIIANKMISATLEFLDQPTLQVVEEFTKICLPPNAKAVILIEQDGLFEVVERDIEKMGERAGLQRNVKSADTIRCDWRKDKNDSFFYRMFDGYAVFKN